MEAAAPLLETGTSALGQVVNSQRIVDFPLTGGSLRGLPSSRPVPFPHLPEREMKTPAASAPMACGPIRTTSFWMESITTACRRIS